MRRKRKSHARFALLAGSIAYTFAFLWAYHRFLAKTWAFWGFGEASVPWWLVALGVFLAVAPALWLPIRFTQPTHFLYGALFLAVHVPSMIVPIYSNVNGRNVTALIVTMFAAFTFIGIFYFVPRIRVAHLGTSPIVFWLMISAMVVAFAANILWVYRGTFRVVTFSQVYEVRFAAREIPAGIAGYTSFWLGFAVDPLLMAYGLVKKNRLVFAAGAAGQLLVYATIAMKSVLLSILILPCLYLILGRNLRSLGVRMIWTAGAMVAGATLMTYAPINQDAWRRAYDLLLVRTLGIPGLNTLQYYEFFGDNGFTHWSHVRGISSFVTYPYDKQVPYLIGDAYYGNAELSANAHFLATDGLAAAGLPGVLIIALVCGVVFYLCDVLAQRHSAVFVSLCLAGPAMALLNVGLFTTLLTDGLALTIALLYLMPTVATADELRDQQLRGRSRRGRMSWEQASTASMIVCAPTSAPPADSSQFSVSTSMQRSLLR